MQKVKVPYIKDQRVAIKADFKGIYLKLDPLMNDSDLGLLGNFPHPHSGWLLKQNGKSYRQCNYLPLPSLLLFHLDPKEGNHSSESPS